jgi:hypothetical protein
MNSTPEPDDSPADIVLPSDETTSVEGMPPVVDEPAAPLVADPALLEARDLALAALRDITPEATIGDAADYRVEPDGVVSLRFENRMPGYPGWLWTVSLARLEDAEPTVLEVELLPDDGALLAPDWVPWAERLADYQAAQVALAELADVDVVEEDLDDIDDLDAADFDEDGSRILHAGDVDGVDIDELDVDADDDLDADDEDDEDDEDDDDDDEDDEDADEAESEADDDTDEYDPVEGDDSDDFH